MMKNIKLLLIVFGMVLLVGCDRTEDEKVIDYITVDQTTVMESYDIGLFSIEEIDITVYYTDETFLMRVELDEDSISSSDLAKLEVEGEHTIEVLYGGAKVSLTVTIVNNTEYEISFDSNGGSDINSFTVVHGNEIPLLVIPTLEGHLFTGWYIDDAEWDFEDVITEDVELTARWLINTYELNINDNLAVLDTLSGEHGDTITYDTVLTKEGYTFEGWYTDNVTFNDEVQFPLVLLDNTTLYTKWELIPLMVFNWNIGTEPWSIDPGINGASDGGDVINNTFEGLVREKNGEVLPGMAESWTVSDDGLSIEFLIREDAKWSDGTPITADDFVRSWKRAMDPRTMSEYSWIWDHTNILGASEFVNSYSMDDTVLDGLAAGVGIESIDDGATLVVLLTQPTDWFVSMMAFYHFMPVPESATMFGEGAWAKDPDTAISNGPFVLSEYTVGEKLVLIKNENYWNAEEVEIDIINGYFIDMTTTAFAKYYAGELDFLSRVPTAEIPGLMVSSEEFYVFPLLGTYYINFNLSGCEVGGSRDIGVRDNEIFCNADLRKALSLSIDRDVITEALGFGAISAVGFLAPGFTDYNGEDFFDNSRSASEIVSDNGSYGIAKTYFELAADALYPDAADTAAAVALLRAELETKTYSFNTSEGHLLIAELIQDMWEANLGFTMEVDHEPWALFQARREDGDFDLARGGWLSDYMDPYGMLSIFKQGNAYNAADYYNVAFEAKMGEAEMATTSEDHFEALYDAYGIFMEDMPVIPIYHYNDYYLVTSRLTGWSRSVLGSIDFSTATIEAE